MREEFIDQEKFYTSLESGSLHELIKTMDDLEEGIFYLIPMGFEKNYLDYKIPVIILVKVFDPDSSPNTMIAVDFKSNFVPSNLYECDRVGLRGAIHFFEKILGFQFSCFSQEPVNNLSRFFGIFNSFLRLDLKIVVANENAFSKLYIPEEEIDEKFENMAHLVQLIRASRDIGLFVKEWKEHFEKEIFFKPSIAVSGFDIILTFNTVYYVSKSSVLTTDYDRNALRLLLIASFLRMVDALSKKFNVVKKVQSEYEFSFPIEIIKPENIGNFVNALRKIAENFNDFFYSTSFVNFVDRISKILKARENKMNQLRRHFNLTDMNDIYKILALVNGTTSKSVKLIFKRVYYDELQIIDGILEDFSKEIEKFFLEVSENV